MAVKRYYEIRKRCLQSLFLISLVLFFYLRFRHVGHLLVWDESQFVLSTRSFVQGLPDFWRNYIYIHPPVYLVLAAFLNKYFDGGARSYEVLSIFFSLFTLLVTYFLAKHLFGRVIATFSAFALALMPASMVLDTWIKQDSTAVFFLSLAIFLFIKEKYVWGGVALGLGMLSKEIAVFALLVLAAFSLVCWRKNWFKGWVIIGLVGALSSFWWYLWFSASTGHFWNFFLGSNLEAKMFARPWYYYFQGLPLDLGWTMLVLAGLGCLVCVFRGVRGNAAHLLPLIWFFSIYIFLSLSAGKPHWMISTALPACAFLVAMAIGELLAIVRGLVKSPLVAGVAQVSLIIALSLLILWGGLRVNYGGYQERKNLNYWLAAQQASLDAELIRSELKPGEKVYIIFSLENRWDPNFIYSLGEVEFTVGRQDFLQYPQRVASYARESGVRWIYLGVDPEKLSQLHFFERELAGYLEIEGYRESAISIILKVRPLSP